MTTPTDDHVPPPTAMTFAHAQRSVDGWMNQWKEGYWPPLANLARLTEEVGELARELNHRHGPKKKKASEPHRQQDPVAEELADIMFVVIAIANSEGIDLNDAFRAMMRKLNIRDADRWERKEGSSSPE
ncbi:MAG: nucleotide pyrophosphohydrolase [Myxococcota bacterium]